MYEKKLILYEKNMTFGLPTKHSNNPDQTKHKKKTQQKKTQQKHAQTKYTQIYTTTIQESKGPSKLSMEYLNSAGPIKLTTDI